MNETQTSVPVDRKGISEGTNGLIAGCIFISALAFAASIFMLSVAKSNGHDLGAKIFLYVAFLGTSSLPLAAAVFFIWYRHKIGVSTLFLDDLPVKIGGMATGLVKVSKPLARFDSLNIQVACIRQTNNGYGQFSTTTETILGKNDAHIRRSDVRHLPDGTSEIPIKIALPSGCVPPKTSWFSSICIKWEIKVEAVPSKGMHYVATFKIPVTESV